MGAEPLSGYPSFFLLLAKLTVRSNPTERRNTAKMNSYEVALIIRPEVEETGQQAVIEQLSGLLTVDGGQVTNVESWGRRRLAYPIRNVNEGYYYFIQGQFSSTVLPELERVAKLSEQILRHMVIRQDD
jgi:small subunit ribosomal protein S6